MPIVPAGSTNLSASGVPNVIVQITPPNPIIVGVPTDIVGTVGTAIWGPVNSPVAIGSMQQFVSIFGNPQPVKYDLGTVIYALTQQNATDFRCVRVTDGTDTSSSVGLVDTQMSPSIGAFLTSIYTGSGGNTLNAVIGIGSSYTSLVPTYRLTVYMTGGVPEVFDNIGGTGAAFWQNLVNAVNLGQSSSRPPSQLVIASLNTGIGAVTITSPGSYATLPTLGATIGTGAIIAPHMEAVNATINAAGTGYTALDLLTVTGGTSTSTVQITVDTVGGGGDILTAHISRAGSYTALPASPVSVTGGTGSAATFGLLWGILSASVTSPGAGYTSLSALTVSGGGGTGGGAGTLTIGSSSAPAQQSYVLSGGTDGNSAVTTATLIGDDSSTPRTGMYALRGTLSSIGVLADGDDPTYWTNQVSYAGSEGTYMVGAMAAGYQDNISGAATLLQTAAVDNYNFTLPLGDWVQINDPFNNQTRFISPQGFKAGILAITNPSGSSLNKPMNGIVATQKTVENRTYSDAELLQIKTARIEVITKPLPGSNSFGCRLGINTSSNVLTNTDNYPRMINFLAASLNGSLGSFIGLPMTPTVVDNAYAAITTFLGGLADPTRAGGAMIGTVDGSGQPFSVVMDTSQSELGILIANVQVVLFSILQLFVVNLQANQGSVSTQVTPPQLARAA